ncbi:hypothetical protein [Frateuria soli]|uniref:hypothetical protein n=1 Tax=Frateuria soli TaxID=1542730 RepID=UPI001E615E16|nr:hypothetical protein [Frateuria soli]UGB38984.1 hypothetical protein LQ771_03805 [Frateuria soli]
MVIALVLCTAVYWPGLSGGWLFDDYPNIVDNRGVQPSDASISSLARAALSSPASDFKRPLASLSFAANYLTAGLDPYWMKLTNLLIHLLNGLLVFLLARRLLDAIEASAKAKAASSGVRQHERNGLLAVLIATAWMVLPINLTGVLYVVQRMESMANAFVLLGLLGYIGGRERMLAGRGGLVLCALSVIAPTALGLLAKETAVMLPLYAFMVEWSVFGFHRAAASRNRDARVLALFTLTLLLPMLAGLTLVVPHVLSPAAFSTRDFTLGQRLLSEARIVAGYIDWTLLPTPDALSFYHDDFHVSTSLLSPWTTLVSLLALAALAWLVFALRQRRPLVSLGLAFFLGCHLLTGTILPLELIYEHRNYFASLGLLLAVVPALASPRHADKSSAATHQRPLPMALPRYVALTGLMLFWIASTALTAYAWGNPLRLAAELAGRAPESPRAQYELGRIYVIYSHYDRDSPFTRLAYAPLERAMQLPNSSILPEQALIFMNARMGLPLKDAWWDSLIAKLKARPPGVQDESSLGTLTQCAREGACRLPKGRMVAAFLAALSHPNPSPRLLATYSDYAWNILDDRALALRVIEQAISAGPMEPAYRITAVRMLLASGQFEQARQALQKLEALNFAGRLDGSIAELRSRLPSS